MKPQDLKAAGFRTLNPDQDVWHLTPFSIGGWEASQVDDVAVLQRAEDCLLMSLRQVMERRAVLTASRKPTLGQPPCAPHPGPTPEHVERVRRAVAEAQGVPIEQVIVLPVKP